MRRSVVPWNHVENCNLWRTVPPPFPKIQPYLVAFWSVIVINDDGDGDGGEAAAGEPMV